MDLFEGIVIEESLTNPEVLKRLQVVSTRVSKVTPDHRTPWLTQWTLHTVTALPDEVASIADEFLLSTGMMPTSIAMQPNMGLA
jgi:hypothetical protein